MAFCIFYVLNSAITLTIADMIRNAEDIKEDENISVVG